MQGFWEQMNKVIFDNGTIHNQEIFGTAQITNKIPRTGLWYYSAGVVELTYKVYLEILIICVLQLRYIGNDNIMWHISGKEGVRFSQLLGYVSILKCDTTYMDIKVGENHKRLCF